MNKKLLYQCLVLFQINCVCLGIQQPEVATPLGRIRGEYRFALLGKRYCAYEGIPYAQPPVGNLRFENPLPVKPWEGVLTATNPTTCLQLIGGLDGDEDCLHLNVYTPCEIKDTNKLYDVIVYIHGGGFSIGAGKALNATYMMDIDRIVVSINFRLGIFGFLSMGDEILPGNYGLKDQVMALQWVQKYISYFYGHKNSVTLAGISAGGASVHLHYLSPLSKGLFNRGISHGGSALMPFVLMENPSKNAIKMAEYVGCPIQPTKELKECLKNKDPEMMTLSSIIYLAYNCLPTSPFAPVIENCTDAFLPAHPYELLKSGNISDKPWIVSSTTNEGIIITGNFYDNMNEIDKNWVDVAPYVLDYYNTIPESRKMEVATKIKDYYLGSGGHFSIENFNIFTEMFGDRNIIAPIELAAKLHAKASSSPVYYYLFGYRGNNTIADVVYPAIHAPGTCHTEDAVYCYGYMAEKEFSESDYQMWEAFQKMLQKYMSTGEVVFPRADQWGPVKGSRLRHLRIFGPNDCKEAIVKEICPSSFWHSLGIMENENLFTK